MARSRRPKVLFAATSSSTTIKFTGFHGLPVAVLAVGVLVIIIWAVMFAIRYLATFPKLPAAGAETSELGPETPAIANLLVNRWKLTHNAMAATMLDLAARKMLEIDQLGSDHFVVRLKRAPGPADSLTDYEQQVLDHVRSRATGGSAPAEALDLGETGEAEQWWKRFDKAVVSQARSLGLARSRWSPNDWLVLGGILLAGLGLIGLAAALAHVIGSTASASSSQRSSRWDSLLAAGFVWVVVMGWMGSLRAIRDTPSGKAACARWLGVRNYMRSAHAFENAPAAAVILWDRLLAYGAALGVAHDAVHDLPFIAEAPGTAWSRSTGVWRQIRIEYPHRFGYGSKPLTVFLQGLVRAIWWGGLAFVILPIVTKIAFSITKDGLPSTQTKNEIYFYAAIFAAVSIVGAYLVVRFLDGAIRLGIAARDLGKSTTYEGTVIKFHEGRAAVDDGKADEIRAWMPVAAGNGTGLSRGMTVRATVTPHLHYVSNCTILSGAPSSAPDGAGLAVRTFGPGSITPNIDAAYIKQLTGLDLPAVDPSAVPAGTAHLPAGSAVQAFADASGNRVVVASITLPSIASKMLFAALARTRHGGSAQGQSSENVGDSSYWIPDRALIVQRGDDILTADVEVASLSPEQRRAAATALARKALGIATADALSAESPSPSDQATHIPMPSAPTLPATSEG